MLTLKGLNAAEKFVVQQQRRGNDVRWDGWDMVFFRPADHGIRSTSGAFRNGRWGFDNRVVVNENGVWEVDYLNVKRAERSGRTRS